MPAPASSAAAAAADPAAFYTHRVAVHAGERRALEARSRRLSAARGLSFLVGLGALVWAVWPGTPAARVAAVAAAAAALAFVALVARHEGLERRVRRATALERLARESLARLGRDWDALPVPPMPAADPTHPYAHDLDVVGHGSLFHLLGGVVSAHGRGRLAEWLLEPDRLADAETLAARQTAIAELAADPLRREELAAGARELAAVRPDRLERFFAWAEGEPWLTAAGWRIGLVRVVTAAIVLLVALHGAGVVHHPFWLGAIAAGWVLTALWGREVGERLAAADPGRRLLEGYPPLFAVLERGTFTAPLLAEMREELRGAAEGLGLLARRIAVADARHMWLHVITQSVTLWNFHALAALERWQRDRGRAVRRWLDLLGDAEALAALAVLCFDDPAWSFASIDPEADRLTAEALAHPLLPPDGAVPNDVTVGPAGTLLLVTGSNMSGKSTLLRAVGLDVVLARAGGPVRAASLRLPPLLPATCMRVSDSLEGGVSYFMAELRRLKRVVDLAERPGGPRVLYLLDEILQGTNSAERHVAAVHVLARLARTTAIGAASTHDLALADAEVLRAIVVPVHFEERVDASSAAAPMTFDYRLKDGPARSTNALRLLQAVGLMAQSPD